MGRTLIKAGAVVTMDSQRRILPGGGILVDGPGIVSVLTADELSTVGPPVDVVSVPRLTAIPGFVQTHVHLCQVLFRGRAEDMDLLDWLRLRIFPFEAAHTAASMSASAYLGIAELIRSGTTTIMDMGSVHHEESVVEAVSATGLRAVVGKSLIDLNEMYPPLKESTANALAGARREAEAWHGSEGGRIRYSMAPRFVLSCSDELLRGAYAMTQEFEGMRFHTHAAESRRELDAVRERCGMGNIAFFESIGLLQENTCLAHCIWLSTQEVEMMAARQAHVLHCPSSNLKLGSGIADVPGLLRRGVSVSIGADGAPCNNTLDMFHEMRLAALIQKPRHGPRAMPAATVFELATLGGARALGMAAEIGSLEAGKRADIVLLDLDAVWMPTAGADVYASMVYSATPENVRSVMVDGRWLYRDGAHLTVDPDTVRLKAGDELTALLQRAHT